MILMRSIVVGFVAMLVTFCLEIGATILWAAHSIPREDLPPGSDVGWDLVSMYHNSPYKIAYLAVALAGFAVGVLLAYRSFSRTAASNKPVAR